MKKLKRKKYGILLTIIVIITIIVGINKISNVDKNYGKIKIENAYINKASANISEANIFNNEKINSYDMLEYDIKYAIDGTEERNVQIKASLSEEESRYASFNEINNDFIKSTISENKREITILIKNVKPNKDNNLKLQINVTEAPNGFKVNPKIEIKEETSNEYKKISVTSAEVETRSVTGVIRDTSKNGVSNVEVKIEDSTGKEIKRTYTDEDGRYTFSDLETGKYNIGLVEDRFEIISQKEIEVVSSEVLDIYIREVDPFKINIKKYIKNVIINGKKYTYGEMDKVNLSIKNLKEISGQIEYKVVIKNEGKKAGVITRIEEDMPQGLTFKENNGWKEINGKIRNEELEGITLKSGETKEAKLVLQIEKTKEAKSYLSKVTIKGEIYEKIAYIVNDGIYKEDEVLEGEKTEEIKMPDKNGVRFSGWYTDKNYTNKYNFNNEVTKDIILYGKYEENVKKYNVIFIDNGNVVSKQEIEEGGLITPVTGPKKEGHTFTGWYEEEKTEAYNLLEPVTRNITLYSKYEINKYIVVYKNYDGRILKEYKNVLYGAKQQYDGSIPSRDKTEEYTYIFTGWSPEITEVKGNQEYIAQYRREKNKYTITFNDEGKITSEKLDYGSVVVKPEDPKKEGHTFTGWYESGKAEDQTFPITITRDITLNSKYKINEYTVKYYHEGESYKDGKYDLENVIHGSSIEAPMEEPEKENYNFVGWKNKKTNEMYVFGTPIMENTELESSFTKKDTFTVTFNIDGDTTIVDSQSVIDGKSASRPTPNPIKKGYVFDGWYKDSVLTEEYDFSSAVTENIILYGTYKENAHIVTYINENEEYEKEKVLDEYMAVGPSKGNPTKEGYTFKYWSLEEDGEEYRLNTYEVTSDITLYAVYDINTYTVIFKDEDGTQLQNETLEYGSMPVYKGETPSKSDSEEFTYEFIGWTPEITEVRGNKEYIAVYEEEKRSYSVSFIDYNGDELQNEILEYGSMPIYKGETPTREATNESTYSFSGWTPEITEVKGNQIYTAEYTETKNEYTVTFMDDDIIYQEKIVEYGEIVSTTEENPSKEYSIFKGWVTESNELYDFSTPVTSNITLYSSYELVEKPVITHTPMEWTKENVIVTIGNDMHPEYTYKYKKEGDEHYTDYTSPFEVSENSVIIAKSIKDGTESQIERHEITNIDKVKPNIISFNEGTITPLSIEIIVTAQDNESGLNEIRVYLNDGESPIAVENYSGNEEKNLKYTIDNLDEKTTYRIKVEATDAVGNISDIIEKEISTTEKIIIAKIIGRNNQLNSELINQAKEELKQEKGEDLTDEEIKEIEERYQDEKYETLANTIEACGDTQCTIQMVGDTNESVDILETKDITLDLNGRIITGTNSNTIINRGNLVILDNGATKGKIVNANNTSIYNTDVGILTLGINEEPQDISTEAPNIIGNIVGIDNHGIFNFYDGRVEGTTAIKGSVNDTPYLYNVSVANSNTEVAILTILAEAEARINTKYYTKVANAVGESKNGYYEEQSTIGNIMSFVKTDKDTIYGFKYNEEDGTLTSTNKNNKSTTANSYIKLDLSSYTENQILTVNAKLSSQSNSYNGYDYGYATITESTSIPLYSNSKGRFIYIYGIVESKDYQTTLEAGKVYYLHLGYAKNSYQNDNDDVFTINSISLKSEGGEPNTNITNIEQVPILNEEIDTVELLKNITLTESLNIDETKSVILDLNGHSLTTSSSNYVINNNGNLTIIDSDAAEQSIKNQEDYEKQQALYDREYNEELTKNQEDYNKAMEEYQSLKDQYDREYSGQLAKKEEAENEYNQKLEEYYLNTPVSEYGYTGDYQEFIVPITGQYKIELWGAQGEKGYSTTGTTTSRGAYTSGTIYLEKDTRLYIYVGDSSTGYNGGGVSSGYGGNRASGGGATDIRLVPGEWNNFDSLKSRIMVSAGGGGHENGAPGGSINGIDGGYNPAVGNGYNGLGATQIQGGNANVSGGLTGKFGIGGYGQSSSDGHQGGGGGGGYYGGSGARWHAGGGSGSSYISGYDGCDAISETSTEDNIIHTGQAVHYSNLQFTDAVMKAGNEIMPTYTGADVMTGNEGNGYAKITRVISEGEEIKAVEKPEKPSNGYTTNDYVKDGLKLHLDGLNPGVITNIWEDVSGNSNNGTTDDEISFSTDNGLIFDGTNDYVDLGKQNYENITIEVYAKYNNISNQEIISNKENGGYSLGILDGKNHLYTYINGTSVELTGSNVISNEKINLTYTYNGQIVKLYENGKLIDSKEIVGTPGYNGIINTLLGADPSENSNPNSWFNGEIYSVRIYDKALTDEQVKNNYKINNIRYNGIEHKALSQNIELNVSNFTYKSTTSAYSSMQQGDNSINTMTSNSNNKSVTYYNKKIKVGYSLDIKGTINFYQNWNNGTSLGTVYIGLSRTNDNTIDDFIEYESFEVLSTTAVSEDFSIVTHEPGEYYLKMITIHNNNSAQFTVYSNITNLEIDPKPVLKEAVRKEAVLAPINQTGNITATTGGLIYNNENAYLSLKQVILNMDTPGTSSVYVDGITNYGTLEINEDSILNDNANYNRLIYNIKNGRIIGNNGTINVSSTGNLNVIDNKSFVQDRLENLTINLSSGSSNGIYNTISTDLTISNVKINNAGNAGIYNYGGFGRVTLENNTISSNTYAIYNVDTELNINSGTYTSNSNAIYNKSNLIINSGTFESNNNGIVMDNDKANVTINDGEIFSNRDSIHISRGNFTMNGGTINTLNNFSYGININDTYNNNIVINGGLINTSGRGIRTYYNYSSNSQITINNLEIIKKDTTDGAAIENARGTIDIHNLKISGEFETGIASGSNNSITNVLENVVIENTKTGIHGDSGGLINLGGNTSINATQYGVYLDKTAVINIGIKDGVVSEYPKIVSNDYGIYKNGISTINYYDGSITSKKTKGIHGDIADSEENYDLNIEEIGELEKITLQLSSGVVESNGIEYPSIQKAIDASEGGVQTKITLLKSIKTLHENRVPENKNIIIDFNGYQVDNYGSKSFINIESNGILKMIDSTKLESDEIITLGSSLIRSFGGSIINNTGTTEIDGVSITQVMTTDSAIENNGSLTINSGIITGYRKGINNLENGILTVNNATINIPSYVANVNMYAIYNTSTNAVNCKNTTIEVGEAYPHSYGVFSSGTGDIIFEDVIINNSNRNSTGIENNNQNATLTIRGGNINNSYTAIKNIGNITVTKSETNEVLTLSNNSLVIENTGVFTIDDILVNSGNNISNKEQGVLTINNGNIKSNRIYNYNTATINIIGGTINSIVQNVNDGIITLGIKDGTATKESPIIVSENSNGIINNSRGTFNFYDGIIKGKTEAINGTVTDIEEGYEIVQSTEESLNVKYLDKLPVAKLLSTNEVYYNLQDAVNNSSELDTIEILRNITYTQNFETLKIMEGKNITIDIKGYNITTGNSLLIRNLGTLNLIDTGRTENENTINGLIKSTGGSIIDNLGNLEINYTSIEQTAIESPAIINSGELIVNSGKISAQAGIYNSGNTTINGGTIEVSAFGFSSNYGISNNESGNIYYNHGTITVMRDDNYGIYSNSTGTVNYEDGDIIINNGSPITFQNANESGTIIIKGGYIRGGSMPILNNSGIAKILKSEDNYYLTIDDSFRLNNTGELTIDYIQMSSGGVNNQGTATINDGNIGSIGNNSELVVNGGNISYIENAETGNAVITGGTIKNESGTAIVNNGIVTLGIKDGISTKETPIIISKKNGSGINNSAIGTFNFYDGIVKGAVEAINGTVTDIEEDYELIQSTEEGMDVKYLDKLPAARVLSTNEEYYSIKDAIDNSRETDTIEILRDIIYTKNAGAAEIVEGKNITIDIKGYNILANNELLFRNNGILNLSDSGRLEGESSVYGLITNVGKKIIENNGTLEINNTNFKNTSADPVITNTGELTFNRGTINASGTAIVNSKVSESDIAEVRIIDGIIKANTYNTGTAISNSSRLEIQGGTISDFHTGISNTGTITAQHCSITNIANTILVNSETGEVTLENGTYSAMNTENSSINNGGTLIINDGNYSNNVYSTNPNLILIHNGGTLTINNGNFSSYSRLIRNDSNLTITMGIFESSNDYSIYNFGSATITGGTYNGGIECSGGNLSISNATINDPDLYGIYGSNGAIININDNVIMESSLIGIYQQDEGTINISQNVRVNASDIGIENYGQGTINIGTPDRLVNITQPEINGGNYGLYNNGSGIINFYDGIISGPMNKSIYGLISELEAGYKINKESFNGVNERATLAVIGVDERVISVNGLNFTSLQSAINSASDGVQTSMTLYSNITLDKNITVPAGKDIIIYLSGNTITKGDYEFVGEGKLKLIDANNNETTILGNIVNLIKDTLDISQISRNVVVYKMDDGSKLQANKTYKLYKNDKELTLEEGNSIGRYNIGKEITEMKTIRGRLYLNNLSEGDYKVIDDYGKKASFTITNSSQVYGNAKENIVKENKNLVASAVAELIISIQTGIIQGRYLLLLCLVSIIVLLLIVIQKRKSMN